MNDLKFAFRQLLKNPGFTAVAVLTLALGIGTNTAIFSVVDAVRLKSLPVNHPERLVTVGTIVPAQRGSPYSSFSYPVFREMREKDMVFSGMFARSGRPMRSLQNVKAADTGYRSDQIVTMALDPAQIGYKIGQLRTFYSDLSQRLATLPTRIGG